MLTGTCFLWLDTATSLLSGVFLRPIAARLLKCPPFFGMVILMTFVATLRIYGIASRHLERYSNDLHVALLRKRGDQFWKCWNSKFESKSGRPISINGQSDPSKIVNLFAEHFSKTCDLPHSAEASNLRRLYQNKRPTYNGAPLTSTTGSM